MSVLDSIKPAFLSDPTVGLLFWFFVVSTTLFFVGAAGSVLLGSKGRFQYFTELIVIVGGCGAVISFIPLLVLYFQYFS